MQDRDLIISQIRQRLEILYQMIEELDTGGGGGEPGTTNYNDLTNKPSINSVTLTGNKTTSQLGLASAAQINQTNTNVSNLSAEVDDIFTPDNITLNDGGFFPQVAMEWVSLHKPISVNDDIYYFIEETGVDYLYVSIPTSGAFPSTSYLRIMKSNRKVEFYNTIIETTPTSNSDNLVTSGGVYTALENKVDKVSGKGLSTNDYTNADKAAVDDWVNGYIYQTAGGTSTKTITLDPTSAYLVFITFGSSINFYFLNSTTTRAYIKTLTDQMSADITTTYDGLSVTFTSTAGNAFTLFARKLN